MSSEVAVGRPDRPNRRRLGERRTGRDRRQDTAGDRFHCRQTLDWRCGRDRRCGGDRRTDDPVAYSGFDRGTMAGSSLTEFLASEVTLLVIVLALLALAVVLGGTAY